MTIKKTNKIKLELLAPAKDLETGKQAILAGADAVYIGGPDFGARSAAGNSWNNIQSLVEFAHKYYAKVSLMRRQKLSEKLFLKLMKLELML